jgi:hypothetical protein
MDNNEEESTDRVKQELSKIFFIAIRSKQHKNRKVLFLSCRWRKTLTVRLCVLSYFLLSLRLTKDLARNIGRFKKPSSIWACKNNKAMTLPGEGKSK